MTPKERINYAKAGWLYEPPIHGELLELQQELAIWQREIDERLKIAETEFRSKAFKAAERRAREPKT